MSWRHTTSPSPTRLDANIEHSNVKKSQNKPTLPIDLLATEAEGGAACHNSDTLKRRQQSCKNILRRFPGRVPVIVEKLGPNNNGNSAKNNLKKTLSIMNYKRNDRNNDQFDINDPDHRGDDYTEHSEATSLSFSAKRYKFLVPYDCTVGQFQWILRNKIEMAAPNRAIYLIIHRTLPHASCLMGELYRKYQNNDGYLYVYYSGENTFGGGDFNF